MDPAAMDFVMHRAHSERPALSPMSTDHHASHSPCPAMRAAAASEQYQYSGLHSPPRGGRNSHYDPVHSSSQGGNWWQPHQHIHHPNWQHPPFSNFAHRSVPYMYGPQFTAPGTGPAQGPGSRPGPSQMDPMSQQYPAMNGMNGTDNRNANGHAYTPPPFNHRPNIPNLQRIGGTAPTQHSQANFGTGLQDSQLPRGGEMPPLNPISPTRQTPHV